MKKIIFSFIYIFLLVVYIYSIVFKIIPISTKIILEGIGVLYCLKYIMNPEFVLKREYRNIIRIIICIIIWDFITCLLNGNIEFHLTKVMIPLIGSLFGGHLIYCFSKNRIKTTDTFLFWIVLTIFLESVLTILMKLIPSVYSIFESILVFDFGNTGFLDIFEKARFFGIGNATFFGVLPSCTLGVITSAFLMKNSKSTHKIMTNVIMYIVISVTSFFVARTSIIIVIISLFLILLYLSRQGLYNSLKLLLLLFGIVSLSFMYMMSYVNANSELETWAFDFLINQDVETGSAGNVIRWWEETKFDLSTFIIGDAQYVNPDGSYYKRVDIGFFREIFYGGIIGLCLNLYLHGYILYQIYLRENSKDILYMVCSFFLSYLVVLGKGDANMVSLFLLYLIYYSEGVYKKRYVKYQECTDSINN